MKSGGQPSNKNAAHAKKWKDALHYALVNYENKEAGVKKGQALKRIAKKVVQRAIAGDMDCIHEIGNRLDGKPAQAIAGGNRGDIILQISPADVNTL